MNQAPSGLEPLLCGGGHLSARLRPEVLTTRPHTDLYLRNDFILMCFGNTVKTKEIQFLSFSRKIRPLWNKIAVPSIAKYDDTQSCKIRSLRLHRQKNDWETQVFQPKPNVPFLAAVPLDLLLRVSFWFSSNLYDCQTHICPRETTRFHFSCHLLMLLTQAVLFSSCSNSRAELADMNALRAATEQSERKHTWAKLGHA